MGLEIVISNHEREFYDKVSRHFKLRTLENCINDWLNMNNFEDEISTANETFNSIITILKEIQERQEVFETMREEFQIVQNNEIRDIQFIIRNKMDLYAEEFEKLSKPVRDYFVNRDDYITFIGEGAHFIEENRTIGNVIEMLQWTKFNDIAIIDEEFCKDILSRALQLINDIAAHCLMESQSITIERYDC